MSGEQVSIAVGTSFSNQVVLIVEGQPYCLDCGEAQELADRIIEAVSTCERSKVRMSQ